MCAHPALSVRTQSPVCAVWPRARGVVTLTLERTPEPGGGLRARVRVGVRAAVPCRVCRCALCGRADARCAVAGAVVSRLAAARAAVRWTSAVGSRGSLSLARVAAAAAGAARAMRGRARTGGAGGVRDGDLSRVPCD